MLAFSAVDKEATCPKPQTVQTYTETEPSSVSSPECSVIFFVFALPTLTCRRNWHFYRQCTYRGHHINHENTAGRTSLTRRPLINSTASINERHRYYSSSVVKMLFLGTRFKQDYYPSPASASRSSCLSPPSPLGRKKCGSEFHETGATDRLLFHFLFILGRRDEMKSPFQR